MQNIKTCSQCWRPATIELINNKEITLYCIKHLPKRIIGQSNVIKGNNNGTKDDQRNN